MLDLFSGSGSASRAAAVRGWHVVRIDNGPGTAADIREDLTCWSAPAELGRFDLVWASPPCTLLSTAGRSRDVEAGLVLVRSALRIEGHQSSRALGIVEPAGNNCRRAAGILAEPVRVAE